MKRGGPRTGTKKLQGKQKYHIEEINEKGKPIAPANHARKFVAQCGVIVRDRLSIRAQEWYKPKVPKEGVIYVRDEDKQLLWDELMQNFTLPEEEDVEEPVIENRCKAWTYIEMGELFRSWKKRLNKFIKEGKTPEFVGVYEKIKDEWPEFKAYKQSEAAKAMSERNKKNADKKIYHHNMGSGGYLTALPKFLKMEEEFLAKGIQIETFDWPDRLKAWFYGHGGKLDPETGDCLFTKEHGPDPIEALREVWKEVTEGRFHPNREKDELSRALKNPEHSGRTRGTVGSVPWILGFPKDVGTYRSRSRKKKEIADRAQWMENKLLQHEKEIAELKAAQTRRMPCESETPENPSPDPKSMRRSSVASTELDRHNDMPGPRHPVDNIVQRELCDLHVPCLNITVKVAHGFALPPSPNGTYHCRPIPDGYAVVGVDEVIKTYEGIKLDFPTGEDEVELRFALKSTCLWKKEYIVFPHMQLNRPPSPQASPHNYNNDNQCASPDTPHNDNQGASPSPPSRERTPPRQRTPSPPQKKRKCTAASTSTQKSETGKSRFVNSREDVDIWVNEIQTSKRKKAKKMPLPVPVYSSDAIRWAIEFLTHPSQYELNMDDDYTRVLVRTSRRVREEQKSAATQKRDVPQLGMQAGQSAPPLILAPYNRNPIDDVLSQQARDMGITLAELKALQAGESVTIHEVVRTYVRGQDLVDPAMVRTLPARLHQLNAWYLRTTKSQEGDWLYGKIPKDFFGPGDDEVQIEYCELWQLFNFDALDKSIISAFCM